MSWTTILWSMCASACLTLAITNAFVWFGRRPAPAQGSLSLVALGAAVFSLTELALIHARTPEEFMEMARWIHLPAWLLVVSLVVFVRVYFHAGRSWLAWSIVGLRSLALVLNFLIPTGINYLTVRELKPVLFLGEAVIVPVAERNPLMLIPQASLVLLAVYVIDAVCVVWRRRQRRRALVVGGSLIAFTFGSTVQAVLSLWGVLPLPMATRPFYFGFLVVMSYELSRDVLRSAELSTELRESQSRMTLAADAASLGIWIREFPKEKIWATEKWRGIFGFGPEEPLTREVIKNRVHPDDRDAFERTLAQALEGDGGYEMAYRLLLPDGTQRWIASRGRVDFREPGHRPVIARGVSLDITQRKAAEFEAQQRRDEVAHLSRVAMLGELSGSLAHELNQPLTAILTNAQAARRLLARDQFDAGEVQEILQDIISADQRAGDVIASLRQLFRKGESSLAAVDINVVIDDVLKLVRSDLLAQRIAITRNLHPDLPAAWGDAVQLRQVLLNLVMNAADAMEGNAGTSQLSIRTEALASGEIGVWVVDTGRGVPDASLATIFEPFHTTKTGGLGLGLTICRSILTAHRSRLTVANGEEGGAVFSFELQPAPTADA